MEREKINTNQIIFDLSDKLVLFFKNEFNSEYKSIYYSDNFKAFLYDNIFFYHEFNNNFKILFEETVLSRQDDIEDKFKKKASSLLTKKIYEEQNFIFDFQINLSLIYNDFYKNYNLFFRENIKKLLLEKIEKTTTYKYNPNKFEKPEIVVYCNTELKKEYGRYKAGEERIVYFKHFFNYSVEYENNIDDYHLKKINNSLFKKDHVMIQEIDELAMMYYTIPKNFKQYEGEIELDLTKQVQSSNIYEIKISTTFYSITVENHIFKYYLYLLLLFFDPNEIEKILELNDKPEMKKFEYFFVIFEHFTDRRNYIFGNNNSFLKKNSFPMNFNLIENSSLFWNKENITERVNSKFNINNLRERLNYY